MSKPTSTRHQSKQAVELCDMDAVKVNTVIWPDGKKPSVLLVTICDTWDFKKKLDYLN